MAEEAIKISGKKKSMFIDKVKQLLPEGGNLNLCLTCGACSSGCPATGIDGMDPRKFLRMAALGMDEEILNSNWYWYCTMCWRCLYVCPMKIDIPQLVFNARRSKPREEAPKGILGSCNMALKSDTCSAMGATEEDFKFVVEDVAEEVRNIQVGWEELQAPVNKQGAMYFLGGIDWTYGTKGWAAENYCLFMADDPSWKKIVEVKAKAVDDLGCKYWLNTE
jgi:Fe-S oxidoreductase